MRRPAAAALLTAVLALTAACGGDDPRVGDPVEGDDPTMRPGDNPDTNNPDVTNVPGGSVPPAEGSGGTAP